MKKFSHLLHIVIVLSLMLAGTAIVAQAQDGSGFQLADRIKAKVENGDKLVIRVSYHDVSNEFAPFIKAGVDQAKADFPDADIEMIGPVGPEADEQVAQIESLLDGVDGLAISSVSTDALAPLIDRALAEGIPVVTFNTDNPDSNRLAFVGQDLVQSGREAGKLMGETLDGKGRVMITTLDAAAQWSIDRETGAREALAEFPDIEVARTLNTGTEPQEIYANIENAMLADSNIDGILSLECCSITPAGEYVKRNDLTGKVKVVGFDLLPSTLELIDEGVIAATIGQAPERQSYEAVDLLLKAIHGETISDVDTGVEIVNADNISKYLGGGEDTAMGFQLADRIKAKVANGEKLVIRVSYHDVSNEFAPFIRSGVDQAKTDYPDADIEMIGPVGPEADEQVAQIESLLDGIDGLAISSVSTDALAPLIDRALAEGIPVVTFNTDNPDSNRLAFLGQDLVQSGREAGKLMGETLDGKGRVMITTLDAAAQWSIDRETGAREALAEFPDIEVARTLNTGTEPQEIYANIENAMLADSNIDGILSLECCSITPAGEYVKRNDLTGKVKVVGFDLLPSTLELIDEGVIAATIGQAPERQSYEAVSLLLKAIHGEPISNVDTGVEIVNADNISKYLN